MSHQHKLGCALSGDDHQGTSFLSVSVPAGAEVGQPDGVMQRCSMSPVNTPQMLMRPSQAPVLPVHPKTLCTPRINQRFA